MGVLGVVSCVVVGVVCGVVVTDDSVCLFQEFVGGFGCCPEGFLRWD